MWMVYWYLPNATGQLGFRTISRAYVCAKRVTKYYRYYGTPVEVEVRREPLLR